jgi:putative DNA primase/helicase
VKGYLASRCLEPGTSELRFHPRTPWLAQVRPCLLAPYRNLDTDDITGISRILVDEPDRWPKTQRKMLGIVRRAAVKLKPVTDTLAVAEGVETAIAANMLGYGPAWALGSAGAVATLPVLPGIKRLILLQENNDVSRDAVDRCGRRWVRAGRKVTRVRPDDGHDDLNDELIAKGIA